MKKLNNLADYLMGCNITQIHVYVMHFNEIYQSNVY